MKKQEIKKDPVRDYIINAYNYLADNRNLFYSAVSGIALVLALIVFLNNKSAIELSESNLFAGVAQNLYIGATQTSNESNKNKALLDFEELLNGDFNQESMNQALIYTIKESIDNKIDITELIDKYTFSSKDDFLSSMYNSLIGDYYLEVTDYNKASESYSKALDLFEVHYDSLIDTKISYIYTLIKLEENDTAKKELLSIDKDLLSFASKAKYDLFLNDMGMILK